MEPLPDGKSLIVLAYDVSGIGLLRTWLDGSRPVDTLLFTARSTGLGDVWSPRVSPDGRWVAFVNSYTEDVWVRSLEGRTLLQVSTEAVHDDPVVWGPDSRHLYYAGTAGLVSIELRTTPALAVVGRRTLPRTLAGARLYDLAPDGKTFVVARTEWRPNDVVVAVNWLDEARRAWRAAAAR